jgi:recombination DNA repair RAD52 pathway protein
MLNKAQQEQLLKGLNAQRVKSRTGGGGKSLSYLEVYDVKAHLIRVFGFGGWSWNVTETRLAFEDEGVSKSGSPLWTVGYYALGTLTIHALGCTYSEAAVGSATGSRSDAHDNAIKNAESDAIKRAAINLGDQFGLSLYNQGATAPVVQQVLVENITEDTNAD